MSTDRELSVLPELKNDGALVDQLRTSIVEHRSLLASLRQDLSMEKHKVEQYVHISHRDRSVLRELKTISQTLEQERDAFPPPQPKSEKELMQALITITNRVFQDQEQCAELRLLLEVRCAC